MDNLGAYYACFNNKKATEFVLFNFRKYFPNSPICLISDGGENFADIANKYNTYYFYLNNLFSSGPINQYNSSRTIEWWNRQKMVCDITKSDYIMILEDDVYIKGKFNIEKPFALKGVGKHQSNLFSQKIIDDINLLGNIKNDYYGMCGGSIYNANIFKIIYADTILDIKNNHDTLVKEYNKDYYQLGAVDANITYHFNKRGYSYEEAEWLTEYGKFMYDRPVIHAWKQYYE
jgi:hypothetical protein